MGNVVATIGIIVFFLFIVLCLVWILLARPTIPQVMVSKGTVAVNDKFLYQHVKTLSVDSSPRDYRHKDKLNAAAAYIKNQFEKMGLEVTEQKITDTSFYRNFAYHTKEDTLDRLDYKKMAQVVQGVFGYVKELSEKK